MTNLASVKSPVSVVPEVAQNGQAGAGGDRARSARAAQVSGSRLRGVRPAIGGTPGGRSRSASGPRVRLCGPVWLLCPDQGAKSKPGVWERDCRCDEAIHEQVFAQNPSRADVCEGKCLCAAWGSPLAGARG